MKSCPNCKNEIKQLKKGGCPNCGTHLFILKGKYCRTSDRDLVRQFLLRLDENYARVRQLDSVQVFSKSTAAWAGGYHLLNLTYIFAKAQSEMYGMGASNLFMDTLEATLAEQWWSEKLSTTQMLYNKWQKVMPQVVIHYRAAHIQETAQTRKKENVNGRTTEAAVPVF